MFKKKAQKDDAARHDELTAQKNDKKRVLTVTCFEPGGGSPWIEEVQPDKEGNFKLKDHDGQYQVSRGSVWVEDGVPRTIINTRNPQTININALNSDGATHPKIINDIAEANWAEQMVGIARKPAAWKSAVGWALGIVAFLALGMMLWQIQAIGNGFEELAKALQGIEIQTVAPAQSGTEAGHQPIAPE